MTQLTIPTLARIRSQMSRAQLILFTGAGFSWDAKDRGGKPIPSVPQLKQELWELCFPGAPFDPSTSLGDLFGVSLKRSKKNLENLLKNRLTVDPDSLPDFYQVLLSAPWLRCYTLNVNDLEQAAARRFNLQRIPKPISSTLGNEGSHSGPSDPRSQLEVVHLNGIVTDAAESLTFSETQYAERIARQEPWYARCVADLTSQPVVFIGTELHEIPLWQHIELRKTHLGSGRDLRPASILISPTLNAARQEILKDYKIGWFAGTAKSFAKDILGTFRDETAKGHVALGDVSGGGKYGQVPFVSQVAPKQPNLQTEYLLGEEPHWSDLFQGRAVERNHDKDLWELASDVLSAKASDTAVAVTGTAGTGKSTALMRLGLKLTDKGVPVLWVDKNSEASPRTIRERVREYSGPLVLTIDDADLFGSQLVGMLQDLVPDRDRFLFIFAVRSSRLDRVSDYCSLPTSSITLKEHTVPPLTNTDIDGLIAVLDEFNRLGILKGMPHKKRREAFEKQAGRQLLVAMIQATSGRLFEEKVGAELEELENASRRLYSLVCVSSALRFYLSRDEILLAIDDSSADVLFRLDRLVARHLITAHPPQYRYRARHRVIADLVQKKTQELGDLKDVLGRLAWAVASKLAPGEQTGRLRRLITRVINHELLLRLLGPMGARDFYGKLEELLSSDYHYWLQRGSLEVGRGDIHFAESFLNQARSMAPPREFRVDTAYAYMLMRKATDNVSQVDAAKLLHEGVDALKEVIRINGKVTPYPYHILGSQGLAWTRRAPLGGLEKRKLIRELIGIVGEGIETHPWEKSLHQLKEDLKRDELMTVTRTI